MGVKDKMELRYKLGFGLLFAFALVFSALAVNYGGSYSVDLPQEEIDDLQEIMNEENLTKDEMANKVFKDGLQRTLKVDSNNIRSELEEELYSIKFNSLNRTQKKAVKEAWTNINNGLSCEAWS